MYRISPAVFFIIVILAVLFFISGILQLLVRYLVKHPSPLSNIAENENPEVSETDDLQRQLQQLFHLHDSGLDQAFIDTLPVFQYKEIVGLEEGFDCAVCLSEFTEKDKLRLLPVCSHAFHIGCIDTWLLSNSSCPLCRGTIFASEFSMENPVFEFDELGKDNKFSEHMEIKAVEVEKIVVEKGVEAVTVRLGKFRKLAEGEDVVETSSSNLDARRCFSMGSYQYIVGDTSLLVPLSCTNGANETKLSCKNVLNGNPSNAKVMDEKIINSATKRDSFSISKIWMWPKKGMATDISEAEMGHSSYLTSDFSWARKSTR